ncbi:tetratricopeptide repeat protein [Tateyamaria omphalii]|uniref:tetratricopeptide repeat protein n=1 Tax=Tateyamaria omphalii TaxID=299262 RepID=UPI001C991C3E|nr:tetratricopeptide repeat protein [Tateyamaria omphalii]MBY5931842.1 tetratricopeptide repeat protein [Tateyamaria omphalii]
MSVGKRFLTGALLAIAMAAPAVAQDQTLADIRQELIVLNTEVQRLKRELSTTGGTAGGVTGGGSVLDRVDVIERELRRLTDKTEQLEFRINSVVSDGTNRVGDLQFRLCELEPGCDIGALGDTPVLGGGEAPVTAPAPSQPATDAPQLATQEKADFERAQEALASGDFRAAADQFATFNETYPGGPLAVEAEVRRGDALEGLGDVREGARAFLSAFTLSPEGPMAAEALYKLGAALGRLGQTQEACVTLAEVGVRFPGAQVIADAQGAMQNIGCS